ncbi:hypothetical protein [Aliiruegeria sabulilitoris]|uniref:hypothetical protein n=1 Tax=Aliiruegeria sabulilitoris TaxID=1510458 RepID=UPI00082B72BF|nr:hypothetical protein [Aliiruegeria sabulilitoris]NDR58958.1 hypothetical protein [Pseudoruegeria sp. M32A2M]
MTDRVRLLLTATAISIAASLPGMASANIAVEDQRSAILTCKSQNGISGAAYIEQRSSAARAAGQMDVMIVPYDQVTVLDADRINACAASRLGLSEAEIASFNSRKRTVVRSIRHPYGDRKGCGRNASVLYRGDLYCQWAKR